MFLLVSHVCPLCVLCVMCVCDVCDVRDVDVCDACDVYDVCDVCLFLPGLPWPGQGPHLFVCPLCVLCVLCVTCVMLSIFISPCPSPFVSYSQLAASPSPSLTIVNSSMVVSVCLCFVCFALNVRMCALLSLGVSTKLY